MECLFSERYGELFQDESNWFGGDDGSGVPYSAKVLIARVMEDFREPISFQPSRYDSYTVDTDALDLAISELNEHVDYRIVDLDIVCVGSGLDEVHALANVYTPHLFDLIELQYFPTTPKTARAASAERSTRCSASMISPGSSLTGDWSRSIPGSSSRT